MVRPRRATPVVRRQVRLCARSQSLTPPPSLPSESARVVGLGLARCFRGTRYRYPRGVNVFLKYKKTDSGDSQCQSLIVRRPYSVHFTPSTCTLHSTTWSRYTVGSCFFFIAWNAFTLKYERSAASRQCANTAPTTGQTRTLQRLPRRPIKQSPNNPGARPLGGHAEAL